jgi:hypothetical protein
MKEISLFLVKIKSKSDFKVNKTEPLKVMLNVFVSKEDKIKRDSPK